MGAERKFWTGRVWRLLCVYTSNERSQQMAIDIRDNEQALIEDAAEWVEEALYGRLPY